MYGAASDKPKEGDMETKLELTDTLLLLILAELKRMNADAMDTQKLDEKAALNRAAIAVERYLDTQGRN